MDFIVEKKCPNKGPDRSILVVIDNFKYPGLMAQIPLKYIGKSSKFLLSQRTALSSR